MQFIDARQRPSARTASARERPQQSRSLECVIASNAQACCALLATHTKLPVVRCARLCAAFAVDAEKRHALFYRARELPP